MNLNDYLNAGDTVELRMGAITARSKVERMDDEVNFAITQPTHKLLPIVFETNESVTFFFFKNNGMYSFRGRYAGRGMIEKVHICLFEATSEVEKNQRRFSYRLPVLLDVTVRRKSQLDQSKVTEYQAKTINLSQEGILFSCYANFQEGTRVMMELQLSENEICILQGDVLRAEPPLHKDEPYRVACKFANMTKRDQAQLAKFILNRQISDRRRRQELEGP